MKSDPYKTVVTYVPYAEVAHLFENISTIPSIGAPPWDVEGRETPDSAYPAFQAELVSTALAKDQRIRVEAQRSEAYRKENLARLLAELGKDEDAA